MTGPGARVIPLVGQVSNAFLVRKGAAAILVDAGAPSEVERLLEGLRRHGIAPVDLVLLVMTHGHADHAGAAAVLAEAGVPVMIGAGDAGLLEAGSVEHLPVTGPAGAVLRPFIRRMRARPVTPHLTITGPTHLGAYGIDATVVPVAGHTPGSLAVVLPSGDAIVGDLVRAGYALGRIRPSHPLRHYFVEDAPGVRRALEELLDHDPTHLYVGHGGPAVDAADVRRRLDVVAPHPAIRPSQEHP